MDRRSFVKNSLFSLLSVSLVSNKTLASVVETLTPESPKVLLYLVETIKGDIKVRATKWVDLPIKRLIPSEVKPETFKALEIVNLEDVNKRRLELWKENNCTGRIGHLLSMGIPMTEEMRKEYGEYAKKNHIGKTRSNEVKNKIRLKAIGRPSSKKGIKVSEEIRKKMSESAKKKVLTDNHKNNIRKWMLENNPFKGKKHSEETKKIIKEKHPSKIKKLCEYCNEEFDLPNYKRSHGDKCKFADLTKYSEKFLFTDRSLKIIELLEKNVTYKEITKQTGYSKNTIIKTNRIYKQTFQ
jgi:DNA-binding NarL/FixJ family response regulator